MKFKFLEKDKISQIPKTSGVYAFKESRHFLYIGKANNLKERIKNHFRQPSYRDNLFIKRVKRVGFIKTNSEISALILEADLIKKYKPKYNILWKDDKNYFYIEITKEELSRVYITHQIKVKNQKTSASSVEPLKVKSIFIGPFVDGRALKSTLKVLRKVFPYYTAKKHLKKQCSWCHLDLCPGPRPNKKESQRNIKNLMKVLKGKNKSVLKNLEKEMKTAVSLQDFKGAALKRDQIRALEKTLAHSRVLQTYLKPEIPNWLKTQKILQKVLKTEKRILRIEAYDISNIQGQKATGSMITFVRGIPDKNFYRRFKIKINGKPNDVAMIKEVLLRRFKHPEWKLPSLILIDGGKAQLNAAQSTIKNKQLTIPVVALAKKQNKLFIECQKKPILLKSLPREIFNLILQLRDEAHRFALKYHQKLRVIDLRNTS